MSRERMFNFIPLTPKKKIRVKDAQEPYVKIDRKGNLKMTKSSLEGLGYVWGPKVIRLYYDIEKRALAWKFSENESLNGKFKLVKPYKQKYGDEWIQFSVKTFTDSLDKPLLPSPRLVIKSYKDTDEYIGIGEVFYVVVPKEKRNEQIN